MKTIPMTEARNHFADVVDEVNRTRHTVKIVRRGEVAAYLSPAPQWNPNLSDETNLAALSGAFDFLEDEPDLYTDKDIKRKL